MSTAGTAAPPGPLRPPPAPSAPLSPFPSPPCSLRSPDPAAPLSRAGVPGRPGGDSALGPGWHSSPPRPGQREFQHAGHGLSAPRARGLGSPGMLRAGGRAGAASVGGAVADGGRCQLPGGREGIGQGCSSPCSEPARLLLLLLRKGSWFVSVPPVSSLAWVVASRVYSLSAVREVQNCGGSQMNCINALHNCDFQADKSCFTPGCSFRVVVAIRSVQAGIDQNPLSG